jgi:FAD/FMN-containing dehydrogenase
MAYGRVNVALDRFLEEAVLVTYAPIDSTEELPAASGPGVVSDLSRLIYRGQVGSDSMKGFRWWMEREIGPLVRGKTTRNSLINDPVAALEDRDPSRSDILHEYFLPAVQFAAFLDACREVIPSSYQELLNITLRYVLSDRESVLAYAPTERIAAVMAFSQEKSVRAESDMAQMTRALIDRVLALGGTYYLPYRLHATNEQFVRAYPRAEQFIRRKLEIDPARVFRNAMWDRYMDGP